MQFTTISTLALTFLLGSLGSVAAHGHDGFSHGGLAARMAALDDDFAPYDLYARDAYADSFGYDDDKVNLRTRSSSPGLNFPCFGGGRKQDGTPIPKHNENRMQYLGNRPITDRSGRTIRYLRYQCGICLKDHLVPENSLPERT